MHADQYNVAEFEAKAESPLVVADSSSQQGVGSNAGLKTTVFSPPHCAYSLENFPFRVAGVLNAPDLQVH